MWGMAMLSYNVFRAREGDVLCAVPEDRPVPRFVNDSSWRFESRVDDTSDLPRAAKVAAEFNGFYIFHPFERPKPKNPNGLPVPRQTHPPLSGSCWSGAPPLSACGN
jgi:hypothetical protein